jgi:hypothetical protein
MSRYAKSETSQSVSGRTKMAADVSAKDGARNRVSASMT